MILHLTRRLLHLDGVQTPVQVFDARPDPVGVNGESGIFEHTANFRIQMAAVLDGIHEQFAESSRDLFAQIGIQIAGQFTHELGEICSEIQFGLSERILMSSPVTETDKAF